MENKEELKIDIKENETFVNPGLISDGCCFYFGIVVIIVIVVVLLIKFK
jgi:hypothetical protein